MKGRANPTDRGVAHVAYRGVIWSKGFGWNRTKLKNSEDKPTTVGFHVDTVVGCAQDWRNNKLTLLIGGWHDANKTPLDISGLDKFNTYDLYLPSQDDYGRNKGGVFYQQSFGRGHQHADKHRQEPQRRHMGQG